MDIFDENDRDDNSSNNDINYSLDIDSEINLVSINGRYGILDWRGFHPSPEPSFAEEIKRDPKAAMNNRFSRAKKLKSQGCEKMAKKLMKEAYKIKNMLTLPQNKEIPKSKLRFSH